MVNRDKVIIAVDRRFFEKVFEPPRQKLEKKLGMNISQQNFTKMLSNSGFKIKTIDLDMKSLDLNKRRRRGGKAFTF
ncbi:MAG: hypothetical protein ACTSQ4_02430 [Candidatus Heimdallarchaeaceae archaeon]